MQTEEMKKGWKEKRIQKKKSNPLNTRIPYEKEETVDR